MTISILIPCRHGNETFANMNLIISRFISNADGRIKLEKLTSSALRLLEKASFFLTTASSIEFDVDQENIQETRVPTPKSASNSKRARRVKE